MKKSVIRFSKLRYIMFALSILVIAGGITGMVVNGGFNLGIDFEAGLSQRVQIAPVALSVTYDGASDMTLNLVNGVAVLEERNQNGVTRKEFTPAAYPTMQDLAGALQGVSGISATAVITGAMLDDVVTGLDLPLTLTTVPSLLNSANTDQVSFISIDEVRDALTALGNVQVQIVGDDYLQEFQIRVETDTEGSKDLLEAEIFSMLEAGFGDDQIVVKQSDYVGPKFSNLLTTQSILMVVIALTLILIYIWIRFHLASAISAIIALAHDVVIMLGFIAVLRLEVTTTTIAAVLTIIGYSLNDTIVVFDRIRENRNLMKGKTLERIIDVSITQSLSRTLITSLTTLLAVLPLYLFAKGSIQLFALNLIVGIVVGTYSSIFIASPILFSLTNAGAKKTAKHLGIDSDAVNAVKLAEEAEEDKKQLEQPKDTPEVTIPTAQRKMKGKRKAR